jgi:hypothetical protein
VALRRHREPETFVLGELAIEYEPRRVTVGGAEVELTATEYELLRLLSVNAGRVVHFDTLLRRICDGRDGADANLVRIFVRTLRAKLGDDPRRTRPGSSTGAAWATACRDPASADPPPVARPRGGGCRRASSARGTGRIHLRQSAKQHRSTSCCADRS